MKALVFPGQGSQHTGMAEFLHNEFSYVKDVFTQASDALQIDFEELLFKDPKAQLNLTEYTQPALLLSSFCYLTALQKEYDIKFDYCAGHSLGEYSALVAAGVINFIPAMKAVRLRGKSMQEAVPEGEGAMLAVMGMDNETVEKICSWAEEKMPNMTLSVANYNAPGQVVVSGHKKICDWLRENFEADLFGSPKRFKFIPLKVSAPFHCKLMQPAQDIMAKSLSEIEFNTSQVPVIQNLTASPTLEAKQIKEQLVGQITGSVRWTESVEKFRELGVNEIHEIGPGKVLTGLIKKIDSSTFKTFNMQNIEEFKLIGEQLSR